MIDYKDIPQFPVELKRVSEMINNTQENETL